MHTTGKLDTVYYQNYLQLNSNGSSYDKPISKCRCNDI